MKNLENNIKSPIILSGDDFDDILRAKKAIETSNEYHFPKRCIIAGLGPDTNIALGYDPNPGKEKLNYHEALHNYILENTDWMIGADCFSMNSIENILNVFPQGIKGKYALFSYPLHLNRCKRIIKDAKKSGNISKDVEVVYVPTKQRLKWVAYELLANIKYFTEGKKKYFRKNL